MEPLFVLELERGRILRQQRRRNSRSTGMAKSIAWFALRAFPETTEG